MLNTVSAIRARPRARLLLRKLQLSRGASEPVIREAHQGWNSTALCRPEQAEGVAPQVKDMQSVRPKLFQQVAELWLQLRAVKTLCHAARQH